MAEKTLAELRTRIRGILREPVPARWQESDINTYINAVLRSVSRAMERQKTYDVAVAAGTETVVLPSDCLVLNKLYWIDMDAGEEAVIELDRQFDKLIPYTIASVDTGTPGKYWLINETIYLRPVPDKAGTLRMLYYWKMRELVNDTDTPELDGLEEVIVAGAVEKAYFEDSDPRYELWNARYTKELSEWLAIELSKYSIGFRVEEVL